MLLLNNVVITLCCCCFFYPFIVTFYGMSGNIAFIIDLSYLYGFGLIREKKERRVSIYCFVDIPEL